MNRSLVEASWLAVCRPPVLAPVGLALVLVLATIPWLDSQGVQLLHGVAVLAACALAGATDDPAAEVAAATPYPRRVRTAARLAVATAITLPVVLLALLLVDLRDSWCPLLLLAAETLGITLLGVALGTVLRARGLTMPAYPAVIGVLGLAVLIRQLPRTWVLVDGQPWGPPWEAALLRWAAVVLLAIAIAAVAVRDPWEGRPSGRAARAPGPLPNRVEAEAARPESPTAPGRAR